MNIIRPATLSARDGTAANSGSLELRQAQAASRKLKAAS
jgi:hypothetical protein